MADPHLTKMNSHPTSSHLTNSAARTATHFARHSHHALRAAACFALHSRSAARPAACVAPLMVACGSLLSLPTVLNVSSAPRAAAPRFHCWRVLLLRFPVVACGPLSCMPTAAFDKLSVFSAPRTTALRIHCWCVLLLRPLF